MIESFTLTFSGWEAVWVICAIVIAVYHVLRVLLTPLVSKSGLAVGGGD